MESPSTTLSGGPAGSPTGYSVSPDVHIEWVYSPLAPESVRWYSYRAVYDPKGAPLSTSRPQLLFAERWCMLDPLLPLQGAAGMARSSAPRSEPCPGLCRAGESDRDPAPRLAAALLRRRLGRARGSLQVCTPGCCAAAACACTCCFHCVFVADWRRVLQAIVLCEGSGQGHRTTALLPHGRGCLCSEQSFQAPSTPFTPLLPVTIGNGMMSLRPAGGRKRLRCTARTAHRAGARRTAAAAAAAPPATPARRLTMAAHYRRLLWTPGLTPVAGPTSWAAAALVGGCRAVGEGCQMEKERGRSETAPPAGLVYAELAAQGSSNLVVTQSLLLVPSIRALTRRSFWDLSTPCRARARGAGAVGRL